MSQVQEFFLNGMRPEVGHVGNLARTIQQPPQMQRTYTIRNDVNLKKNTLRLVRSESEPSHYHLEFSFDASTSCECCSACNSPLAALSRLCRTGRSTFYPKLTAPMPRSLLPGTIKIFYAAVEAASADGTVTYTPLKGASGSRPPERREKGLNQKYRAETPLDVSEYGEKELTYAASDGRFPIIVCLEASNAASSSSAANKSTVQSQTTFANIIDAADGGKTVQPIKQKIQVGATSYELQEIYGIEGSSGAGSGGGDAATGSNSADDGDEDGQNSRECVICMTEPRDTTVLPCRHMCMCSECAKVLRMQSEKCPICRTPIEQLLQIKISKQGEAAAPAVAEVDKPRVSA